VEPTRKSLTVTPEEAAELLRGTFYFAALDEGQLRELAAVAVPRSWDRGEVIFREGDSGDTCYVVRSGAVLLTRHRHGRALAIAELRRGQVFGELALFRGERRSATAETLEPTTALALLAGDVERLIRADTSIAMRMLAAMAERVSATTDRLVQQSFQTVPGRVAATLLAQVTARQREGAPDRDVEVLATQAEIAGLAGTTRESASRFLQSLARDGVVTLRRGRVIVHTPERLRAYIA